MPPTWKKLVGHIASGASVHPSIHSSCFLMHSITLDMHATVLKFLIWIPHEKIDDTYFFFSAGLCPFSELLPFEKKYICNLVSKISLET